MIASVGDSGSDPSGLIRYFADTQSHRRGQAMNLHIDPRIVTGSLGYTGALDKDTVQTAIDDLRAPALMFPEKTRSGNHIWQVSLVLAPGEGPLEDETWKNISTDFMREMHLDVKGPSRTRWVSVNHGLNNAGSDHVHLAVNLICENGHRVDDWKDWPRAKDVAGYLEEKYGLRPAPGRGTGLGGRSFSKSDHTISVEQGRPETRRVELERRVRAAATGVLTEEQFVQNLRSDGIGYRKHREGNGYAVNLPETTTKGGTEHWWAGGKLARDLSLPRLRLYWKNNRTDTPKHMQAVDELVALQLAIPTADAELLGDISHQVAGALAVVSQKTEPEPGPIAAASHQAGRLAQTRTYTHRVKPTALSVALLFLMATDPGGPVGKAVMIKQLMATYRALLDAHRARRAVVTPERTAPSMAGAEDEVMEMGVTSLVTAGAVVLERHARNRADPQRREQKERKPPLEPWDRHSIRGFREQDRWEQMRARAELREALPRITPAQTARIHELAGRYGSPAMAAGTDLYTQAEAAAFITGLELNVPPEVVLPKTLGQEMSEVDAFMDGLEAKHGAALDAKDASVVKATPAQIKWLTTTGGFSDEDIQGLSKSKASELINSRSESTIRDRQNAAAVTIMPTQSEWKQYMQGHGNVISQEQAAAYRAANFGVTGNVDPLAGLTPIAKNAQRATDPRGPYKGRK